MGQTKEEKIIRQLSEKQIEKKTPIATDMYIPNHSGIKSHPEFKDALGDYVPYTGAISDVDLGSKNFTTTGTIQAEHLYTTDDLQVGDDILLGSGSVMNWNSGNITLTHSSNTLTFAGMSTLNLGASYITTTGIGNFGLFTTIGGTGNTDFDIEDAFRMWRDETYAVRFIAYANAASKAPYIYFSRAHGSHTSKSAVANNDRLGSFLWQGYDGSAFLNSAAMIAYVDGAVSPGVLPTRLSFETTTTNAANRKERLKIGSDGKITMVAGVVTIGGTSASDPYIDFKGAANNGDIQFLDDENVFKFWRDIYMVDNKNVLFGTGRDAKLTFTGTQFQIQSDVVTETDSLLLRGGTNGIAFNIGATEEALLTATTFDLKSNNLTTTGTITGAAYKVGATAGIDATFSILDGDGVTSHNFVFTKGILTSYSTS